MKFFHSQSAAHRMTTWGVCFAASLIAVGCGSSRSYQEPVVTSRDGVVDYRRRPNEAIYQVPVKSVRAVVGPTEQRCWIEREKVSAGPSVGGAVAGAVIGGIIGHQIGSGRGNDVATVGGAVAGGAVGANVGKGTTYRDVQRCENTASSTVEYWDVAYDFRGVEHRVQMTSPPGATITVNSYGEPRV